MNAERIRIPHVTVIHRTMKAILVKLGTGQRLWIPLSQTAFESVRQPGEQGTLIMAAWWADRAGIRSIDNTTPPARNLLPEATHVYRGLIREFHPDVNPEDATTTRALNQLWQAVQKDLSEAQ